MRWIWVIVLVSFSLLFFVKGIELWSVADHIDGAGIGITFLGVEVSDTVMKSNIPGYALGFTVAALIPLMVAISIARKFIIVKKEIKM